MHEEEIKWTPQVYRYIRGGFFVAGILLAWTAAFADSFIPFYLTLFFLIVFITLLLLEIKKANVKYDSKNIDFKWFFIHEKIALSDVKSICWNTRNCLNTRIFYRRYYAEMRIFLYFELNDRYWVLSDVLDEAGLNDCIEGKDDNIPLMRIYKFYESEYPQKAGGLRTENDKW